MCFPFFFLQWSLCWIHLSWNGWQLQLQTSIYSIYTKQFSSSLKCHDLSLLHGSISRITSGTSYCSHGVIQGLQCCIKHKEKYTRTARDHFLLWYAIYWKDEVLTWKWLVSHGILSGYPQRKKWQPTPVFLPEESHGQRTLLGCSPWVAKELNMT